MSSWADAVRRRAGTSSVVRLSCDCVAQTNVHRGVVVARGCGSHYAAFSELNAFRPHCCVVLNAPGTGSRQQQFSSGQLLEQRLYFYSVYFYKYVTPSYCRQQALNSIPNPKCALVGGNMHHVKWGNTAVGLAVPAPVNGGS